MRLVPESGRPVFVHSFTDQAIVGVMFVISFLSFLIFPSIFEKHQKYLATSSLGLVLSLVVQVQAFCGDSIKWSHNFNMEDVYGMWYGVGYAQHTPDITNIPNEVGCVTLYIEDASIESHDDWLDGSIIRRNYTDQNWRSYGSNPWFDSAISGSWLDIRIKRKARRDLYNERRIRVIWDEDGQSMEQSYLYTPEEPGLWVADKQSMLKREMRAGGIDVSYPDEPPKHPQVIRILEVTLDSLIINHCSEQGNIGVFSLILRRYLSKIQWSQWYDIKKQLYNFELPSIYRYTTVCAGCVERCSLIVVLICVTAWLILEM